MVAAEKLLSTLAKQREEPLCCSLWHAGIYDALPWLFRCRWSPFGGCRDPRALVNHHGSALNAERAFGDSGRLIIGLSRGGNANEGPRGGDKIFVIQAPFVEKAAAARLCAATSGGRAPARALPVQAHRRGRDLSGPRPPAGVPKRLRPGAGCRAASDVGAVGALRWVRREARRALPLATLC